MKNLVMLVGRLGADPDIRNFPNGDRVASFSVATSKLKRDPKTNTLVEGAEWHRVRVYGPGEGGVVDRISRMCKKGSLISLQGELTYNLITGQDGIKRQYAYVDCRGQQSFTFISSPAVKSADGTIPQNELGSVEIFTDIPPDDVLGLAPEEF